MTITRKHGFLAAVTIASLAFAGCDLDVGDLNNPGLDELEENPTAVTVNAACTGLIIGNRGNFSAANGYVSQLGILGRESYNFDAADPRYVGELLTTSLNPGSPFGGNFWTGPYANIRLSNIVIVAADKVDEFSDEEKSAIKGFAKTIQAVDLLEVTVTRDTNGVVVDTNREPGDLGPLVDPDVAYDAIASLLDDGAADLDNGGDHFTFPLSSGYAGFDDPAGFRTFNRAILARVRLYQEDYAGALTALGESFLFDDPAMVTLEDMATGVYHAYSTAAGDTTNGLINPNIYAHENQLAEAEAGDQRAARKLVEVEGGGGSPTTGLGSSVKYTIYERPDSPTPIIRNEELMLIKAEALWFTDMKTEAIAELNLVRTVSAGLGASTATPTSTDMDFITALLHERRYSLMFEGGHRWIDHRRLGVDLPIEDYMDGEETRQTVRNVRYPIPKAECDARGGAEEEPRCALSAQ